MSVISFLRYAFMNAYALTALFIINFLGTIYGYYWYGNQLVYTYTEMNPWLVLFVPDSPTASLFFTLTLLFLIADVRKKNKEASFIKRESPLRSWVEAFAVITSLKYGIWAVVMIFAGAAQGNVLEWTDWMLVGSHLGMAAEVILFSPFMKYGFGAIAVVAVWTLLNDIIDYYLGVFPWLPRVLHDDLPLIQTFTMCLSLFSISMAAYLMKIRRRNQV